MNWTFGIITDGNNEVYLTNLIDSIINQNIKNYEVIVVGNCSNNFLNVKYINFDEFIKQGWITKKKNIIIENAKYDNICILHDYYLLTNNWYKNITNYDWDIYENIILTKENIRHSYKLFHPYKMMKYLKDNPEDANIISKIYSENFGYVVGIPHSENRLKNHQYISGGCIIAKRRVLLDNLLNENLCWGDAEDLEWSERVIPKYNYYFNENSIMKVQKPNKWNVKEIPEFLIENLVNYYR